jgi:hypothetical protein
LGLAGGGQEGGEAELEAEGEAARAGVTPGRRGEWAGGGGGSSEKMTRQGDLREN